MLQDSERLYRRVFGGADGQAVMEDLEMRFGLDPNALDDNTNRAFRAIGNYEVVDFIKEMIRD